MQRLTRLSARLTAQRLVEEPRPLSRQARLGMWCLSLGFALLAYGLRRHL
jgi:hypothetical protein